MKRYLPAIVALGVGLLYAKTALALTISGGIDPYSGLSSLAPNVLKIVGIGISGVCMGRGVQASFHGHTLIPAIGGAVGGALLAYGGPYLLSYMGAS